MSSRSYESENNSNIRNNNNVSQRQNNIRFNINTNLRNGSIKSSQLFAITVTYVEFEKQYVYDMLHDICSKFLIAEERHFNQRLHHHIYMRTIQKYHVHEIFDIINEVYEKPKITNRNLVDYSLAQNGVLVETVRNEQTYLKYITKSDTNPLFKGIIDDTKLSFYYNAINWAENTAEFDCADPFVMHHPQYYKLLERVHSSVQNKKRIKRLKKWLPYYKPLLPCQQGTWQEKVIDWWNDWIINGYKHKKKQLFLWGGSNTGKTRFIRNLIKTSYNQQHNQPSQSINDENDIDDSDAEEEEYESQIFCPLANEKRFAWQDFEPNLFNLVLIDEFDINEYNLTELKKVLAGESLIANRKGQSSRKFKLKMPMIIISNVRPPANDLSSQLQGVIERLQVVRADRLIIC